MKRMVLASVALAAIGLPLAACGTDASGVDGCRKIEEARCRRASACGVDLERIRYVGGASETNAVDGCVRYYREACLHGFIVQDPGPVAVQSCVDVLNTGSCDVVKAPETNSACAWLIPPAEVVDAGTDTAATADAATE